MAMTRKKKLLIAFLVSGAGVVFQLAPNSCNSYFTAEALSSFNFCAVLNCTGGTFFNFCEPVALLMDCPNLFTTTQ